MIFINRSNFNSATFYWMDSPSPAKRGRGGVRQRSLYLPDHKYLTESKLFKDTVRGGHSQETWKLDILGYFFFLYLIKCWLFESRSLTSSWHHVLETIVLFSCLSCLILMFCVWTFCKWWSEHFWRALVTSRWLKGQDVCSMGGMLCQCPRLLGNYKLWPSSPTIQRGKSLPLCCQSLLLSIQVSTN